MSSSREARVGGREERERARDAGPAALILHVIDDERVQVQPAQPLDEFAGRRFDFLIRSAVPRGRGPVEEHRLRVVEEFGEESHTVDSAFRRMGVLLTAIAAVSMDLGVLMHAG